MPQKPPAEPDVILDDDSPVIMPDLPSHIILTTVEQFKAVSDPLRRRILNIVRHEPSTAKQIADRLEATPGAVGHHLQVMEKAGLVQVVARRVTRGIVAKYYTRTAQIFMFDMPPEATDNIPIDVHILGNVRDELAEAANSIESPLRKTAFPHARLSQERANDYLNRLNALVEEFLQEPDTPDGQVYGLCFSFFESPSYLQSSQRPPSEWDT